jgi:hypothetical protein
MDHYPEVAASERECASRRTSDSKSSTHQPRKASPYDGQHAPPLFNEARDRNDSVHSEESTASQNLAERYTQYTDAPPPYSEKQYEGKSEEQQTKMRMTDYAKELKRMMGKQLVRGLKDGETKVQ